MIIPNHWHFQIIAYEKKTKEGKFMGGVYVDIIDCDIEKEALKRAKGVIKRKGYYLSKAWQCHHCLAELRQQENAERLQKTMTKLHE